MGVMNPMLHHDEKEWSADRAEGYEYHSRRGSAALWIAVVMLAAVLGALIYYGFQTVRTQDLRISQVFGNQGALSTLGQRADAAESKLHDLAGNWEGMGQRMTKLEGTVAAGVNQTRRYADTLSQQLHQQITAEMDARTSTLDARLRQVESEQAEQRAQMEKSEANLNQEISAVREENGRDLSSVRQQEESDARGVTTLSQRLDRQRIDFELTKGQTTELAPGITLQLRGTNVAHQRYHGALTLAQAHRTVWLRDQSADQPVRFLHKNGEEPYELVVTDVTKKAVAGYLLTPVKPDASAAGLAAQQASANVAAHE
jgi:hypothetical protein